MYRFACAAPNCRMRTYNFSKEQSKLAKSNYVVSFHKFPSDPKRKAAWIEATNRTGWNPTEQSCLCSLHFKDDSFNENNQLFDNALPTIFFDDFHGYIKNLIKNINLEVELESDSNDTDDTLHKSLKDINTEILEDGEEIVEYELAVSDDEYEIECEEVVLSESEVNDDSISHTHDSNSSTTVSTPLKPAVQKKTDDVSSKLDDKSEDIQVVYNKVPGPHELIENAQHSDLPKNSSTTKPIGFRNIKMKELPSEPSETAKKLFSMIQCGSFNKFTVMQPASRSLVCQLLNIVKLVNSQNAQNGVDTSVPSTYIITTKQENRGTEANKTIVSMETAEIVSLITKTVQSIKDGEFKKSENISIICGSPAIFLIKNVIIANSDRNMNSVYVITARIYFHICIS